MEKPEYKNSSLLFENTSPNTQLFLYSKLSCNRYKPYKPPKNCIFEFLGMIDLTIFFFFGIDSRMADATPGQQQQQPKGWNALRKHVMDYKIDVALWATRIATLLFTIGYFIPLFW